LLKCVRDPTRLAKPRSGTDLRTRSSTSCSAESRRTCRRCRRRCLAMRPSAPPHCAYTLATRHQQTTTSQGHHELIAVSRSKVKVSRGQSHGVTTSTSQGHKLGGLEVTRSSTRADQGHGVTTSMSHKVTNSQQFQGHDQQTSKSRCHDLNVTRSRTHSSFKVMSTDASAGQSHGVTTSMSHKVTNS